MKVSLQKRNYCKTAIIFWCVFGILLLLVWGIGDFRSTNESFIQSTVTTLDEGWVDKEGNKVVLPVKLNFKDQSYEISKTIDTNGKHSQSVLLSAKYLNVYLYLNDVEIGSILCQTPDSNQTLGKKFALISLPDDIKEGTLRIKVEGLLDKDAQYEIKAPQMGEGAALIYEIIMDEASLLIVNFVILCFGVFLLIYGIQALRAMSRLKATIVYHISFLYIGLFAILFSFYSFVIMDTIYIFFSDSYVLYLIEFLLLALIPIPLLQLVMGTCSERWKKILGIDCVVLSVNFIMQLIFHFGFGIELKETILITHILMVITAILLIPSLISTTLLEKGKWWLPVSFCPILIGALIDIGGYYVPNSYQKAFAFQCGVLIFMVIQSTYLVRQNLITCESNLKSNVYRQMAYTDALTGLGNRAAFEKTINKIQEKLDSYSSIWCISADINELKKVNDTLGHVAGDDLIKEASELLHHAIGEDVKLYRTGGDEFVCFLFDQPKSELDAIYNRIEEALKQHKPKHDYQLSIALGIDRFNFSQPDSISKLISRSDVLMYQDKHHKKKGQHS